MFFLFQSQTAALAQQLLKVHDKTLKWVRPFLVLLLSILVVGHPAAVCISKHKQLTVLLLICAINRLFIFYRVLMQQRRLIRKPHLRYLQTTAQQAQIP
nr:MAG TPA: hypothetical protein [Caudoviricetes sp.]